MVLSLDGLASLMLRGKKGDIGGKLLPLERTIELQSAAALH
uniref:Uncharacterized protein n=1 Tax=Setaria italica TaxID=4555 RepID=K4A4J7_SETIT